jgi:hypothetical protein
MDVDAGGLAGDNRVTLCPAWANASAVVFAMAPLPTMQTSLWLCMKRRMVGGVGLFMRSL